MAKRIIDPQLAEALMANPNVEKVTRKSIVFKASFINRGIDQYLFGGKPRIETFEEAGPMLPIGDQGRLDQRDSRLAPVRIPRRLLRSGNGRIAL